MILVGSSQKNGNAKERKMTLRKNVKSEIWFDRLWFIFYIQNVERVRTKIQSYKTYIFLINSFFNFTKAL